MRGDGPALLEELSGPEVAAAMAAEFGVDFGPLPWLITVRRVSAAHEGSVHTDSASKVANRTNRTRRTAELLGPSRPCN